MLLPIFRLDLQVSRQGYDSYRRQLHQQHDINRVFLHVEEVLLFFPPNSLDALTSVVTKLAEKSPYGESLVPLIDVFTTLAMFLRGPIEDKGRFLFELFNLSKQSILSETEHALMMFRMSRSLQKLGIFGRLDFSMDDVKHEAFVARYIPATDSFVPGLNVDELIAWMTSSRVGRGAAQFTSVLNRLLKVCIQLDKKAASLLHWLSEMKDHRQHDLPVPKIDFNQASLHKGDVYVVYRGRDTISLAVSTFELAPDAELFVQCNKHMKFSKSSEKYYKLISYRRIGSSSWSSRLGRLSRIDICGLEEASEYTLVVYQPASNIRYPMIAASTRNDKGLTSQFDTVQNC